ncbi:MAG TPA: hypothetical protein VFT95_23130 [Micromonosporaceae bacterium]|nr:hypothetical protein [Micromonosporaceae bacterium]
MSVKVTLDIFSGRPNPIVVLRDAQARELLERLGPQRRLEQGEPGLPPEPPLGYRGLVIEQTDATGGDLPGRFRVIGADVFGAGLSHRARDEAVEDLLIGPEGMLWQKVDPELRSVVRAERRRLAEIRAVSTAGPVPAFWTTPCRSAPLYEPAWWNATPRVWENNCYNYGTNYRTDTFAQPGLAADAMYKELTGAAVLPAAEADQLINVPGADNRCPLEGQLVALVIWPDMDFHWYRKGRTGTWSHKPGGTPVTAMDNAGHTILDPRTADRGPYSEFTTFMVVMHGHIKIR